MRDRLTQLLMLALTVSVAAAAVPSTQNGLATSVRVLPAGRMRIEVSNTSKAAITAMAIVGIRTWKVKGEVVRSVRFFDGILNPYGRTEIEPGQSYSLTLFGPNPPPNQLSRAVKLEAVLFADGSSWGDPEWIAVLVDRRSSALKYNTEALNAVNAAVLTESSSEDLSQRLGQLRSDEMRAAASTAERQMADFAFDEPMLELQDAKRSAGVISSLSEITASVRARLQFRISRLRGVSRSRTN